MHANLAYRQAGVANNTNLERLLHKTIKKVTEDIDDLSFNTAVSALMIFLNEAEKQNEVSVSKYQDLIKLIYPFAPHMAEEIWHEILGNKTYLHEEKWPEYDKAMLREDQVNVVVQVNGKVRDTIVVSTDLDEEGVRKMALESEKVSKFIGNNEIKKVIFVQGKLINFVI
jgi:leucyl-tRNA synthetase